MKWVLLTGIAGFAIIIAGFYIGFLYIENPNGTVFLLVIAILLFLLGLFLLYKAEQKGSAIQNAPPTFSVDATELPERTENVMERNNRLVSEWNSTSEKKDKLQMIKYAAEANTSQKKY